MTVGVSLSALSWSGHVLSKLSEGDESKDGVEYECGAKKRENRGHSDSGVHKAVPLADFPDVAYGNEGVQSLTPFQSPIPLQKPSLYVKTFDGILYSPGLSLWG